MFTEPVSEHTVINTVLSLKTKTSSGYDDVSSKLMKNTIYHISTLLTHIINLSLMTGVFPEQLKIAKVIPVYKASDTNILNNYRPISLLPAFSKLLEKIMYNKVILFLLKKKKYYTNTNTDFVLNIALYIQLSTL